MNRDLLDSYLPTAIYDFFATRYVRIFKKESSAKRKTVNTCFVLPSLTISTVRVFEPLHTQGGSENLKTREENRLANGEIVEVGVSVSAESMTALMSIRKAINLSKTPHAVRGLAKYWAAVCDTVEKYILKSRDKLLHAHLEIASKLQQRLREHDPCSILNTSLISPACSETRHITLHVGSVACLKLQGSCVEIQFWFQDRPRPGLECSPV